MKIDTVTIIGANGSLGKTIAGIFASFGNATVYLITRSIEKSEKAKKDAALSVKANSIEKNLIVKTYDDLKECIKKSDLVFESVKEDYEIKSEIHKLINEYANKETIIATGTSGLSINKLANNYNEELQKKFIGIHFFNPPYNLTLCELIPSKYNKKELVQNLKDYLTKKLYRNVVIVKDRPGFLGNRIGFQFLNESLQYAEKYKEKGGIDYIDTILGCFTGRNMSPLKTINFVGLDVHKAIVDNIYLNINDFAKDTFSLPMFVNNLISAGCLGAKTYKGLYLDDIENQRKLVYDIVEGKYREIKSYKIDFIDRVILEFSRGNYKAGVQVIINDNSEESKICLYFLLKYIVYSLFVAKEVSEDVLSCDDAMSNGFNWIPPHALIEILGGKEFVKELCDKYLIDNIDYNFIVEDLENSKYDYRKFLKAIV